MSVVNKSTNLINHDKIINSPQNAHVDIAIADTTDTQKEEWIFLKKIVLSYGGIVAQLWGGINSDNAIDIHKKVYQGDNLFLFLLSNKHYSAANTLASKLNPLEEIYLKKINFLNHKFYVSILRVICQDNMLKLFDTYHQHIFPNRKNTMTDELKKHYKRLIVDGTEENTITNVFYEFCLLTNDVLEQFFKYVITLNDELIQLDHNNKLPVQDIHKLSSILSSFEVFSPIVYRTINYYYLYLIKNQINNINNLDKGFSIVVEEYLETLNLTLQNLPTKYVSLNFCDSIGRNIMMEICYLGNYNSNIIHQMYNNFFDRYENFYWDLVDIDGNTIFHHIAKNKNEPFLKSVCAKLTKENKGHILGDILIITNKNGESFFDYTMSTDLFVLLQHTINFLPDKYISRVASELINDFSLVHDFKKVNCNSEIIKKIYTMCVDNLFDRVNVIRKTIFYDIPVYTQILKQMKFFLHELAHSQAELDELSSNGLQCVTYWSWLRKLIEIDEFTHFQLVLQIFFSDTKNIQTIKSIHRISEPDNVSLLQIALKYQNLPFIFSLIQYNIDWTQIIAGEMLLIHILRTNNIDILKMVKEHYINDTSYHAMLGILSIIINEKTEKEKILSSEFFLLVNTVWNYICKYIRYIFA